MLVSDNSFISALVCLQFSIHPTSCPIRSSTRTGAVPVLSGFKFPVPGTTPGKQWLLTKCVGNEWWEWFMKVPGSKFWGSANSPALVPWLDCFSLHFLWIFLLSPTPLSWRRWGHSSGLGLGFTAHYFTGALGSALRSMHCSAPTTGRCAPVPAVHMLWGDCFSSSGLSDAAKGALAPQ